MCYNHPAITPSYSMKNFKKLGMVLTECLTAIALITVCIVILSGVITSSASSTAMSKDYVIAQNLANEATNAVEIVRNSNWLICPDKKNTHWLATDPSTILKCPLSVIKANTSSFYIPVFNTTTGAWSLQVAALTDLDLSDTSIASNNLKYRLKLKDIGGGVTMYIQNSTEGTDTKFYRRIKFTKIDQPPPNATTAEFEVKVEWLDGAKVRKFISAGTINNYSE